MEITFGEVLVPGASRAARLDCQAGKFHSQERPGNCCGNDRLGNWPRSLHPINGSVTTGLPRWFCGKASHRPTERTVR